MRDGTRSGAARCSRPRAIEAARARSRSFDPICRRPSCAVDGALAKNPAGRPTARELADALRGAATTAFRARISSFRRGSSPARRLRRFSRLSSPAGPPPPLPFYPHSWPVLLALVALATTLLRERAGIALALAVPVFPLGNISLGLALLMRRSPQAGCS